jgi:hypothetical protein
MDDKAKREKLFDSLYRHCQYRTSTSREVFDKIVVDIGLIGTSHIVDQALEIIRPYKNTGINLESTIDMLYHLFYPTKTVESTTSSPPADGYNMDWDPNSP